VIVASTTPSVLALKAVTTTVPIVFFVAGDPIALGLVASLNRPGGNLTGTTTLTLEVGSKWLQLLHEMVPTATTFALLVNPTSPNLAEAQSKDLRATAHTLGLQIRVLHASNDRDLDTVFATLAQQRVGGLTISSDSFLFTRSEQLAVPTPPARAPSQGPRTGGLRNSSLIAPSDGAHTPVISLDGHRPAATAEPAVIGIVVIIVSVAALTVTRSADVDPNAARTNVHTLSEGRCRSRGSHCANQSKRDQRCLNPHELFLSVPCF
jgi:ABC transporter substrate binding protein